MGQNASPYLYQEIPWLTCDYLHAGHCSVRPIQAPFGALCCPLVFIASFVKGFRFYLPIHLVPYLIRHYRDVWTPQGLTHLRRRVGGDTLKSSLFLSLYTSVWIALVCIFRNFEQRDRPVHAWIAGFICSSAVLVEPPSRRSELNIYTLARWMSMGYRALEQRGYVAYHKNGEVPLFCFAMAVIMYEALWLKDMLTQHAQCGHSY